MSTPSSTAGPPNPAKVDAWLELVAGPQRRAARGVDVSAACDLTTSPSAKRASFPYPILPPLRHVGFDELLRDVLRLPDVLHTALGGMLWGAGIAAGAGWMARARVPLAMRGVIGLLAAVVVLKWLAARLPRRQRFSEPLNVCSTPGAVCQVTGPVVTVSNSHAGTHADSPLHFCGADEVGAAARFHPCCYAGECVVLDVSASLAQRRTREIDDAVLADAALMAGGVEWAGVWRLVLCTTRFDAGRGDADVWRDDFAYLSVGAANFLTAQCPRLLLLATDAPSVDRSDASPIREHSHGCLWKHRVAIVENVDCAPLYRRLATVDAAGKCGIVRGTVQCVFNDAQKFVDAAGCNVLFYCD